MDAGGGTVFLRKLTVIVLPLLLLLALIFLLPYVDRLNLGLFTEGVRGLILGIALAMLLPLSGASRHRAPFAGLLWIPTLLIAGVIVYQYLETQGTHVDVLHILATKDSSVIFLESLFMGYMGVTCLRTHK